MCPCRCWVGGWVVGYTNLEFWGEAETADRAIRIWKMRNLTEPGKINQEVSVDEVDRAPTAEQFNIRRDSRQESMGKGSQEGAAGGRRDAGEGGGKKPSEELFMRGRILYGIIHARKNSISVQL